MYRTAAFFCFACAISYLATGAFFLLDPSAHYPAGSDTYWQELAKGPLARQGFLFSFGLAGLCALGVIPPVRRFLDLDERHLAYWGCTVGMLGYAVTSITYLRLLGGEAKRAEVVASGDALTSKIIQSFSLSLDTQGWLIFGCVGLFLLLVNLHSLRTGRLPKLLCVLGLACSGLYFAAFAGLFFAVPDLTTLAAAAGGVVLGPVWWIWLGACLFRSEP
ncbi:DUF4386 family protein [Roseibium suaedae]|uniref:DUF4386 domain-containing protein n=1 Tax=Roseibium suaedae TaxID=735517 RepID=A0A1M7H5B2_9HYPH|nr:DUF4386 family protein [Roseibium suaedae]SHM23499.1 hypothetical protein SAMN05444272_2108 [Roseibium suaedae]